MTQGFPAWQPIQRAPKDGTRVLVWIDLVGDHVNDRSHVDIACISKSAESLPATFTHGHIGKPFDPQPIAWMPLPEPPI